MSASTASAGVRPGASVVAGEFPFTERDFARISALAYRASGIHLAEGKANLVYSRLAKRLRALALPDFAAYCALVESEQGAAEREAMIGALTTNVTRFFREPHHFEHFRSELAERLAARARAGGKVRLWSAACSTGEEPYSLALTLLEVFPDAPRHDVRILATDIDRAVLARAERAVYSEEALAPAPRASRDRWFARTPEGFVASSALRTLVRVRPLNLVAEWPIRVRFDAIFCRNVAIYFDAPTQERLWARFAERLEEDGRLYIGHSERIDQPPWRTDGLTVYRKDAAGPGRTGGRA